MSPPLALTAILLLSLAVCFLTGRLLVAALSLRRLRRLSPESAAAGSVLGFALWTTVFALATGPARLTARPATLVAALRRLRVAVDSGRVPVRAIDVRSSRRGAIVGEGS